MHHSFQLRTNLGLVLTDCLQIHLFELPKHVPPSDNALITDPVQQWLYFFCRADESSAKELAERLPDAVCADATGVLEMTTKNPDERRFYNMRLKMERDARLGTAQAFEEGRRKAFQEAYETGLAEGEIFGRVRLLQELNGLARQSIAELAQLPSEELAAMEHELTLRYYERREAPNGGVVSPVDPPCQQADFPERIG